MHQIGKYFAFELCSLILTSLAFGGILFKCVLKKNKKTHLSFETPVSEHRVYD